MLWVKGAVAQRRRGPAHVTLLGMSCRSGTCDGTRLDGSRLGPAHVTSQSRPAPAHITDQRRLGRRVKAHKPSTCYIRPARTDTRCKSRPTGPGTFLWVQAGWAQHKLWIKHATTQGHTLRAKDGWTRYMCGSTPMRPAHVTRQPRQSL